VKWALLIGLLTAVISVSIGVIYGVMSAYLGGWKDSLMQRIFEIFISVPLLPVLIVMSAVFKPSIWVIILIMSIFYWVGPVKTVRSMGLQIKEETYIEASRALGASNARIIFKHMVPLLIPYAFASMALYVPGAIVVEATLSLLGLGDPTIVTWGQILQDAHSGGAMLSGMWWWVVPPGLAIALMGMTFAFVGFAMDKILNPKLKTR
jgi:peptide/nickel transport system permease protein